MLTIYNTTVPVTSQEQVDRLKQACIDNGLPILDKNTSFEYAKGYDNYFFYFEWAFRILWLDFEPISIIITESEWMELLTQSQPKL